MWTRLKHAVQNRLEAGNVNDRLLPAVDCIGIVSSKALLIQFHSLNHVICCFEETVLLDEIAQTHARFNTS